MFRVSVGEAEGENLDGQFSGQLSLGGVGPPRSIMGDSSKKGEQFGKWDREEFFASGSKNIDALMISCGSSICPTRSMLRGKRIEISWQSIT